MAVNEPGGPNNYETPNNFASLVTEFNTAWGNNNEAVIRILEEMERYCPKDEANSPTHALTVRAENRYVVPVGEYQPDTYPLEHAILEDEPLQPDGRGPRVAGELVSISVHDIQTMAAIDWSGLPRTSPQVYGVILRNVSVGEGGAVETESVSFVPFAFMTDPSVYELPAAA